MSDISKCVDILDLRNFDRKDPEFTRFHVNSKKVCEGTLFFAIKGKHHDGHSFLREAWEKGATAAVVEKFVKDVPIPQILVRSTVETLGKLAKRKLEECGDSVRICITGSNGKTTTKELIHHHLSKIVGYPIFKNEGNMNTEIGLPLTILNDYHGERILVLELGINKPGDMDKLVKIIKPSIGIFLNLGSAHVGNFDSLEELFYEKAKLIFSLEPFSLAIINEDDIRISNLKNIRRNLRYSGFGRKKGRVRLAGWSYEIENGSFATRSIYFIDGKRTEIKLKNVWNEGQLLDLSAVLCLIDSMGYEVKVETFEDFELPDGRFKLSKVHDILLIDDTYNSNVESVKKAVGTISNLPAKKRIAVIGAMKELGKFSGWYHAELGRLLGTFDIVFIYLKDPEILMIRDELNGLNLREEKDPLKLAQDILSVVEKGDLIYFKASRAIEIERVMEEVWRNLSNF